ncbi:MAG: ROK family protein [Leptolyngbyaceae cyanobacterium SL_7_1]|nr:ROK family protein [Leptolyngbyaceae cyanobacterium SL_7_1]
MTDEVIGIDLGGSAIKLGRFDRSGQCSQSLTIPTPQPAYPEAVLAAMVAAIAQLDPDRQCHAIGVGTPGPADAAGRVARVAINLTGWRDVPLADWLEAKTGKPTVLANDANCAGLGEYWIGAGKAFQNLILLTLGTGVGGAIVLNGELFTGHQGTGAELGLITLNPDGPNCNSGNRGSLEQYVSVQAIRRQTGLEPHELAGRAQAGDREAIAFWQDYGRYLGAGLASLVYVLTPEAILIGGGVSASAEFFLPTVWQELEQRVLPSSREGLQILTAHLGNQAGIVGAAKLAWQHVDHPSPSSFLPPPPSGCSPLELSYRLAVEMVQFKAGFLARTAHELRSPLNSVISVQQLILADLCESPQEEREFTIQANLAAKRMLGLLDEVIAVSKTEYGSALPDLQPLSLAEVLEEVHVLTHMQAQNRSLKLIIDFPDPAITVLADRRWLKQVLVNLIETPIGLMQEGSIWVTTQVLASKQAIIQIQDQRPIESWSEPSDLLQLSSTTAPIPPAPTRSLRPMGLTLLVCQTLLEQMQGRLELIQTPVTPGLSEAISPRRDVTTCIQCQLSISS